MDMVAVIHLRKCRDFSGKCKIPARKIVSGCLFFRFSGPDSGGDRAAVRGREAFSGSGRRLRSVPSGPAAVQFPTPFRPGRSGRFPVPGVW